MTLRKLTAAAVFTIAAGLALPAAAEAGHRHSRSCGHRSSYDRHSYDRHSYRGGYRPAYRSVPRYSYDPYRYGYYDAYPYSGSYYRPYRYARPYRYPAPIYRYRSRPHVSIHLDF